MTLRSEGWRVQNIPTHAEVVDMVTRWHYSKSAPNTSTCRHGLLAPPFDGDWMGGALWIPPTKAAAQTVSEDWRGVLALSRFVISPEAPRNAASFLLGRSMKMIDRQRWHTLLTYADTRLGHTGGIYKATNWECLGEVPAGDVWIGPNGEQRGRKRGRFTYTKSEMEQLGFTKAPAMPKIKYVHRIAT